MTDLLPEAVVGLNTAANAVGRWLLAPIAVLPGWLSATLIAAMTGVLLLVVFKYTSNQRAIQRVRDDIKANLLALKLFKDSASVALVAQGRILEGAGRLFVLALVPMAIMALPVTLVLAQLSLWYQARPLRVGEEAVVTVKLQGDPASPLPKAHVQAAGAETTIGPVRLRSKREICWAIQARQYGYHQLTFQVGEQVVAKELAVGEGFLRVSVQRPGWSWSEILLYPWEKPFRPDSPIRSIEIDYPRRDGWISGTDAWVVYWFAVSMIAALCFRRALGVHV
jgi:hypothetical protein